MHNLLSKFKLKAKSKRGHMLQHLNPHAHWIILLKIFFVLAVFLIALSLYILYKIKNDQIFTVTSKPTETPSLLKEDLLQSTLKSFDQKAQKTSDLKTQPLSYSDPSL